MSLEQRGAFVKHPETTIDAFLGGRLSLEQPRRGFRAGLDSVLLGAAVAPSAQSVLDLGAGVGTAGLVALAHAEERTALLAEADAEAVGLARRNVARNSLEDRAAVTGVDVLAESAVRIAAGLANDRFDSVIANPPFFASGSGTSATARGRAARQMPADDLERWVRTATAAAAPAGEVLFILPAAALAAVLAAYEGRLGAIAVLPLVPRAGDAATRLLIRGIKGSRAPLQLFASRVLHGDADGFAAEFEAILRGRARLHW